MAAASKLASMKARGKSCSDRPAYRFRHPSEEVNSPLIAVAKGGLSSCL